MAIALPFILALTFPVGQDDRRKAKGGRDAREEDGEGEEDSEREWAWEEEREVETRGGEEGKERKGEKREGCEEGRSVRRREKRVVMGT